MKIATISFLFVVICSTAAIGQKVSDWQDLLSIQKDERTALYNRQDSEYRLLVELQKTALGNTSGDERLEMGKAYIAERERLSLRQAAERTELLKTQLNERKEFREASRPKNIASLNSPHYHHEILIPIEVAGSTDTSSGSLKKLAG